MNIPDNLIHIKYFSDFHAPTLLIVAKSEALFSLAKWFESRALHNAPEISLRGQQGFSLHNIDIKIVSEARNVGIKKINGNSFVWRLSPPVCIYFSGLVLPFVNEQLPRHQYLESYGSDDVQVMLSVNEYDWKMFEDKIDINN